MEEKKDTFYKDYQALCESFDKITKSEDNPFFKSKYVPLCKILPLVKKNCKKHNFWFIQYPNVIEGKSVLITQFMHLPTGKTHTGAIELVHKPEDPQKMGGSITYMRRYTLSTMLGLEEVDDDGNSASGNVASKVATKKPVNEQMELAKKGLLICADCGEPATVKRDDSSFYCKKAYMEKRPGVKHDKFIEKAF